MGLPSFFVLIYIIVSYKQSFRKAGNIKGNGMEDENRRNAENRKFIIFYVGARFFGGVREGVESPTSSDSQFEGFFSTLKVFHRKGVMVKRRSCSKRLAVLPDIDRLVAMQAISAKKSSN